MDPPVDPMIGNLRLDRAGAFHLCDAPTRDSYVEAVQRLARRFGVADLDVAKAVCRRRRQASGKPCRLEPDRLRQQGVREFKLEEFNQHVTGDHRDTSFVVNAEVLDEIRTVRYVITLDEDDRPAPGGARKLVGAIAYPLNQPWLSADGRKVVRGYSILRPRKDSASDGLVGLTQLAESGPPKADYRSPPAGHATPSPMRALLGEDVFVGHGIYDLQAFGSLLDGRITENSILSHDTLKGIISRVALRPGAAIVKPCPTDYLVHRSCFHRWVPGDIHLILWLFRIAEMRRPYRWIILSDILGPISRDHHIPGAEGTHLAAGPPERTSASHVRLGRRTGPIGTVCVHHQSDSTNNCARDPARRHVGADRRCRVPLDLLERGRSQEHTTLYGTTIYERILNADRPPAFSLRMVPSPITSLPRGVALLAAKPRWDGRRFSGPDGMVARAGGRPHQPGCTHRPRPIR